PQNKESSKPGEAPEEHSYKQGKKLRANLRSTERDHKKTFEGSFMLDSVAGSLPKTSLLSMDPRKPYLSLACGSSKLPLPMPVPLARTARQTSRTDCPADRLKFFETLRLLLKLTSISSKKKEKEQRYENTTSMGLNNEVIWLELQAWHARRSTIDQDLYLYTARQAIPEVINDVLNFKVNYRSLSSPVAGLDSTEGGGEAEEEGEGDAQAFHCSRTRRTSAAAAQSECQEHLQRQRLAFEQVKNVMESMESVEALYPSLNTMQKGYEKYADKDFQGRVQALCLWLNITKDLNQKLRVMGTVLGIRSLSDIGWPVFEIPSPRNSKGNEDEEDEENDSTATYTADSEAEELLEEDSGEEGEEEHGERGRARSPCLTPKLERLLSEDDLLPLGAPDAAAEGRHCPTSIYRPFVDKALKQMGLRKLILRLHKLMDRSLQRARAALMSNSLPQEYSEFPDPMLYNDYLPELSRLPPGPPGDEESQGRVSWADLVAMDLPSFQPAFLVLCRVLLNVIHECLKLRLEQRPAGEPSLLSIKQLVRECKEVLKGGLLMKQYYQFMLRGVVQDLQGLQGNANIDEFEEDLHKMLMVYFDYMRSWIQMLQQLPQASHSLKNLLEEEWDFTKVITPYIRGGEAQSGKLFCDIAGMLLKSTGDFLETGLQKSCDEFWESADDSTASDEIRRSVIETSRSLKELFHEARERASKALGFAKMLRKDLEIAADFIISAGVPELIGCLKEKQFVKVELPGLEDLQVLVPEALSSHRAVILQLLNAAAGKDCSKEPDDVAEEAYLLMTKLRPSEPGAWAQWQGTVLRLVPQVETVDTLRSMQVDNLLMIVMHSGLLANHRKNFQQNMEDKVTLSREQTSSQPVIARALEQLKNEALQLSIKINNAIDRVEYMFTSEFEAEVEESESATLQQYYREAMIQSYNFAFEYHKEVVRLMSGEFRQRIGEKYITFARKWMNYVLTKCESGRGTRPRWATQGFDFLQATEPAFISALPEDDFLSFQTLMNDCIGHVIGKPQSPVSGLYFVPRNSPRPVKVPRCHSDPPNPNLFIPNPEGFRRTEAALWVNRPASPRTGDRDTGTDPLSQKPISTPTVRRALGPSVSPLLLQNEALQLSIKINNAIDRVEYMFTSEFEAEVEESESATLQQYYREAMIQSYNFAFEYHKEVVRLMSGEFRQRIGEKYITFARKWMNYVLTKCESGRGTRPRWATQGFDFLQATEPAFISALPEDDFLSFQTLMNDCIGHVIGKPQSPVSGLYFVPRNSPRPVKVPRCHSDPPNPNLFIPNPEGFRGTNLHENDRLSSVAAELQFRSLSRHSSPTEDREEPSYPKADPSTTARRSWELRTFITQSKDTAARQSPMEAVRRSIRMFEDERYAVMKQRNIIGQVCNTPKSYDNVMHVGLRKVTFKWQRGNKIGEGQYGKVYTCINVDSGELMAMKEIRFQPNDHKTIKETADELKIFEGIKHPNLVRYFGVELHREEMYIFMEYCDEGTLEEVSRLGLQEHVIRLYSKQITTAINTLHEHGIVHRDIKGANIFLTSSGLIKLGDFGCSVKLKNNAQTMPGEVNSTLGTAAYMAPEVITRAKGEGHGRAADIWSLGCVLIEMVTGKRPWHEYEHNFQIMYKVGMGHKPPIPEKLSTEGKDFLCHCLESEPKQRWTASALLDHPFVKVTLA
ncbi:M3K4 kinase, partial [Amia calva]|nr:M3K4 kinase [Amia calva]